MPKKMWFPYLECHPSVMNICWIIRTSSLCPFDKTKRIYFKATNYWRQSDIYLCFWGRNGKTMIRKERRLHRLSLSFMKNYFHLHSNIMWLNTFFSSFPARIRISDKSFLNIKCTKFPLWLIWALSPNLEFNNWLLLNMWLMPPTFKSGLKIT